MSKGSHSYLPRIFYSTAKQVVKRLLGWFDQEGREFVWRSIERATGRREGELIHDPYMILVSEMMLQQTQTARVTEKLPVFLEKFPTVGSLACASRGELLRAWQGMGYNRRALRLQETAQAIIERYDGRFPSSCEELESLPGVGNYTASAIACFAFGQDVAVVDVNVIRVLSRLFYKCHTPQQVVPEKTVMRVAEAIIPKGDSYRWHQALMDFGATVCTARRPACEQCSLAALCLSAFPMPIELFGERHAAKAEPSFRGEPRRVWRGRVIEFLRNEHAPLPMSEVIDRLISSNALLNERHELLRIAGALFDEGMIERRGVMREGELQESDLVSLPE